jgi:hypothetical protein
MHRLLSFFLLAGSTWARPEATIIQQHPPVVFEPNRGQDPAHIQWIAQGNGYRFLFTNNGVTIKLAEQQAAAKPRTFAKAEALRLTFEGGRPLDHIKGTSWGANVYRRKSS